MSKLQENYTRIEYNHPTRQKTNQIDHIFISGLNAVYLTKAEQNESDHPLIQTVIDRSIFKYYQKQFIEILDRKTQEVKHRPPGKIEKVEQIIQMLHKMKEDLTLLNLIEIRPRKARQEDS